MNAPAAWHPDPTGRHDHRYWDGERWTEHVADAGVATTDPLDTSSDDATSGGTQSADTSDTGPSTTDASAGGDASGFAPMSPIEPTSESGAGASRPEHTGSPSPASSSPYGPPASPAAPGAPGGYGSPYGGGFPAASPVDHGAPQGSNPMAVIGMVFGIASIVFSWVGVVSRFGGALMLLAAIAAIVLSSIGKSRANKGRRGNGMAITGIVTGIVGVIAAGLFLAGGEFWRAFSDEFSDFIECIEETGDEQYCQRQFEDAILERDRE